MFKVIVLMSGLVFTTFSFGCDQSKQPCDAQAGSGQQEMDIQEKMQEMTPMFGNMIESMMSGRFKALANPQVTEQLAKFSKSYFDSLVKAGFTEDQAIKIVIAVGIPSAQ